MLDISEHSTWEWNLDNNQVYLSPGWKRQIGFLDIELKSCAQAWLDRIHPDDLSTFKDQISKVKDNSHPEFDVKYRIRNKDNQFITVNTKGYLVINNTRNERKLSGIQTIVTGELEIDPLTKLANEKKFLEFIQTEIDINPSNFAILVIHVDAMHNVTGGMGTKAHEELIGKIAEKLHTFSQDQQVILGYLRTNHFGVLLKNIGERSQLVGICQEYAKKLEVSYPILSVDVYITFHIGATLHNQEYENASDILSDTIAAALATELKSYDFVTIHDPEMAIKTKRLFKLKNDLYKAISHNQLIPYFQPIINLQTNETNSFEVLLRWDHLTEGLVPPDTFISLAEECGLIHEITYWLIDTSLKSLKEWQSQYALNNFALHINISPSSLLQKNFVNIVANSLQMHDVAPSHLKLELTEDEMVKMYAKTKKQFMALKEYGIHIALDDFGKGYSSLAYLSEFNFDSLKIDKYFCQNYNQDILELIIKLAHALNMELIAEGIETHEMQEIFKDMGCEYGQGYLYSKPQPFANANQWFEEHKLENDDVA